MSESFAAQTELHLKKTRESLHAEFADYHGVEEIDVILDDSIAQIRSESGFDD